MSHQFTDYFPVQVFEEAKKDPDFAAFHAGFEKAKEIYSRPPGQLAYITSSLDWFLWWKEHETES